MRIDGVSRETVPHLFVVLPEFGVMIVCHR